MFARPDIRVSVILPTYNRLDSLPHAIASVLSQSERELELIVVDDASTQDIGSLIEKIADPRITLVRRVANGGAGAARNTGLEHARGQFIAFQDSDDLWLPGKLTYQLAMLEGLPAAFGAVTGPKILHGRDSAGRFGPHRVCVTPAASGRMPPDVDQTDWLLGDNRLSVQCALFRADCMPTRQWFDTRASANEDYEFAVRLSQHVRICEYAQPLVLGSVSEDSISRSRRRQTLGDLRILQNNRAALERYPRHRAMLLRNLARFLMNDGKPRLAARYLAASLALDPTSVPAVASMAMRRMANAARRRLGGPRPSSASA